MEVVSSFRQLTDPQLAIELARLAAQERCSIVELVACLEEFDRRRLYLGLGFSSLYTYCQRVLHLGEGAAYRRIEVARASRRCPELLDMLRDGRLSLATACLVAQKLGGDSTARLLEGAAYRTKREVEVLIATLHPQPPVPAVVRKLPDPKPLPATPRLTAPAELHTELRAPDPLPSPAQPRRPTVVPLSEAHYKLQVTITTAARERLAEIQGLMRHRLPSGDPAAIVEHALEVLHAQLLKQKAAQVAKPRAGRDACVAKGRYIPASVKRQVWQRDEGRCAFISGGGTRCGSADGLEFHHVRPYAVGGEAAAANIEMRCRAHNGFEWQQHLDAAEHLPDLQSR